MRNFVVAAWERRRNQERELSVIEADTAEHAIVRLAASRPVEEQAGVYEAWPVDDPGSALRLTFAQRRKQP
ncbi:MAG: hypothetical protein AB7V58_14715 [Solirubrobacterales bacterium]